ncbi:hypothetical protein ACOZ38_25880 [Sphaerisporangium viridialbum]|uniref:hypothetical protein n=1 Tax=Sphaerisporangium viridialbum TaxID=46189 RepID=UPI003C776210
MLCFATMPRTICAAALYPRRLVSAAQQVRVDEELLVLLVTTWAIRTGRIPPARPPGQLTAEELMEFWADDQIATGDLPHNKRGAAKV